MRAHLLGSLVNLQQALHMLYYRRWCLRRYVLAQVARSKRGLMASLWALPCSASTKRTMTAPTSCARVTARFSSTASLGPEPACQPGAWAAQGGVQHAAAGERQVQRSMRMRWRCGLRRRVGGQGIWLWPGQPGGRPGSGAHCHRPARAAAAVCLALLVSADSRHQESPGARTC